MHCQQLVHFLNILKKKRTCIFQQARQTKNALSLSIDRSSLRYFKNHERVRAVLTERQTSDCDVNCRILDSVEISGIRDSIRVEKEYEDFVKVMQDSMACFHLLRVYILFIRQP